MSRIVTLHFCPRCGLDVTSSTIVCSRCNYSHRDAKTTKNIFSQFFFLRDNETYEDLGERVNNIKIRKYVSWSKSKLG